MNPNDRPDPRDNPEYWRTDSEGYALYLAEKKAGAHRSKVKHRVVITVGLILALGAAIAYWFANRR